MSIKKHLLHFAAWMLYFLPDKQMLQLEYRIRTGRKLELTPPTALPKKSNGISAITAIL